MLSYFKLNATYIFQMIDNERSTVQTCVEIQEVKLFQIFHQTFSFVLTYIGILVAACQVFLFSSLTIHLMNGS